MVDEVSAVRQRETLVIQDKLNLLQSLLDNADADRERLDRELRRAQQDQVAKDKVLMLVISLEGMCTPLATWTMA